MFYPKIAVSLLAVISLYLTGCQNIYKAGTAGDKQVRVCGHIVRQTFPGPPNYESVAAGDLLKPCFWKYPMAKLSA